MSFPRWMSLMRRVCFLWVAAIFAASFASAQSLPSPNQTGPSLPSAGESSSSSFQLASDDGDSSGAAAFSSAAALASASPAGGSGAGQQERGWKHEISNNFAIEAGAGANAPIGNDTPFITWGGNFTVGAGLHLSKRIALLAEYQFMDDKLPGNFVADVGTQGGHAHIWSLTLDPVIDLFPKRTNSIYVTGGGGFYRKVTSFTDPEEVEECYYYCGIGVENEVVGHYSSNQGGENIGVGITHRMGGQYGDGKSQLFAEVRYLFLNTPEFPPGFTEPVGSTELIPVTLGFRW